MTFQPISITLSEAGPQAPYRWKLTAPLTWTGRFRGTDGCVKIPASPDEPFETDLASVPRSLTWLLPRYGKYTKAAVLHDYLCQNFRTTKAVASSPPASPASATIPEELELKDRSDADEVFRQAMRELGVPWARRWVMWSAVNWATIATSLWPGRRSKPLMRSFGWAIVVLTVAAAIWLPSTGALRGDSPGWMWLRVIGLVVGTFAATAAGALLAGYVAQSRWDRWLVDLVALGTTIASLPLLAAGALVTILLVFYLVFEDMFSGFSSFRTWLRRRRPPFGPETPRAKRLAEVRAS